MQGSGSRCCLNTDAANKDGYDGDGDGDDDGVAMLANGTEVARRDVDATSKQGDVRWMPLHCFIVD